MSLVISFFDFQKGMVTFMHNVFAMNHKFSLVLTLFMLIILAPNINLIAQDDEVWDSKKLLKDVKQFEEIISAHPDPYKHVDEKVFKDKLKHLKTNIDEHNTTLAFYKELSAILALIKDGHTSARLPEFWLETQRKQYGVFPYEMYLSNKDELYVVKSFNNGKIPIGALVKNINDIPVAEFLNNIDPFISYELKKFRNTLIDDDFEKYLYLAFGYSNKTKIEYEKSNTEEVTVANMPFKEWKKFDKKNKEEKELRIARGEPYEYKNIGDGIGLLKIYAFVVSDFDNYKVFLSKTFKSIKNDNIHSLIIDIRGNYGGWPKVASNLFHYISDSHFKTMAQSSMKISYPYRNYLKDNIPALRNGQTYVPQRRHFVDVDAILRNEIGSNVKESGYFNEKPYEENSEFEGDCYLLTNRDSYSAASSFASTFQCYQMGVIIGEETGGTKIFRANPIYNTLNKTSIRIAMSTTKMFTTCFNEELEGVKPSIEYSPTIYELTANIDTHLEFAKRIIKKIRKKIKEGE